MAVAKVIIDVALDQEFDYRIPESLAGTLKVGMMVKVPFGRSTRDGYILISEGLSVFGRHRSPDAVKMHAKRALSLNLSKYPASGVRKCIECGKCMRHCGMQAIHKAENHG